MPVSISCPKCQTKYSIPDNLRGKPVKCKSCGATFRSPAPVVAGKGAASPPDTGSANRVSPQDLKKFGIAGQLTRPPEIFTTAPQRSPAPNMMGNYALEDPGFVEVEEVERRMASRKKGKPEIDLTIYATARMGMRLLFYSLSYLVGIAVVMFGLVVIGMILGSIMAVFSDSDGEMVGGFLGMLLAVLGFIIAITTPMAGIAAFVGQVFCVFAPYRSEKLAAGLVFGTVVAAFVVATVGVFVTGMFAAVVTSTTGRESGAAEATATVVGFLQIGLFFGCWLLALSSMYFFISFYRTVGRNIESKELVATSNLALVTWATALVVAVLSGIAQTVIVIVAPNFPDVTPESFFKIFSIISLVNFGLGLATTCTLLSMLSTGVKQTLVKDEI